MRKLLILLVAGLLVCGSAFAASNYESDNVVIFGPNMGADGITPPQMIVKISLGSEDGGTKGDVLTWDVSASRISDGSGLGYVVRLCDINDASGEADGDMGQYTTFAGVLVTTTSKDSNWTTADAQGPEVGYMCVKGYVDAKITANQHADKIAVLGRHLVLNGANLLASFTTLNAPQTGLAPAVQRPSRDIGVLLEAPPTSGISALRKVWLY
jgi:hypothetical protein